MSSSRQLVSSQICSEDEQTFSRKIVCKAHQDRHNTIIMSKKMTFQTYALLMTSMTDVRNGNMMKKMKTSRLYNDSVPIWRISNLRPSPFFLLESRFFIRSLSKSSRTKITSFPELGKGPATKSDEILEIFQTAFDSPPPYFWKIMLQFFYNGYCCNAYMQGGMRAR